MKIKLLITYIFVSLSMLLTVSSYAAEDNAKQGSVDGSETSDKKEEHKDE